MMNQISHGRARIGRIVLLVCLAIATASASNAAQPGESRDVTLKTKIIDATIYSAKAHVTRRAEVEVKDGAYRFICEDLPEGFIESSLQVEGAGTATVRIVGIDLERREKSAVTSPRFDDLNEKLRGLKQRYANLEIEREALSGRKEIMSSIGRFSLEKAQDQLARETFSVQDWKVLLDFFEKEKIETAGKLEAIYEDLRKLNTEMQWIHSELGAMQVGEDVVKAVVVDCEVATPGTLRFDITYMVPNANWRPEYTIRYMEPEKQIELTYNAKIWQSTGEDWQDVSVLLSTAKPHVGAAPPELPSHYLLLGGMGGRITGRVVGATTGAPLPYANVVVIESKMGAVTRSDGSYEIANVPVGAYRVKAMMMGYKPVEWSKVVVHAGRPALVNFELAEAKVGKTQEIVVQAQMPQIEISESKVAHRTSGDDLLVRGGRGSEVERTIKAPTVLYMEANVTSSEFAANLQIRRPIDLETGAEPKRSLVVREMLPGMFSLYGVPRLSENVFVEGTFTNTVGIPLLPGQSEVYVETSPARNGNSISNFVGREMIEPVAEGQEFTLHLGIDQDIRVLHKLEKKERLSKTGKKTAKVRYFYVISIESFKKEDVEIRIKDRIPVSMVEEVDVDDVAIDPEPGEQKENGILIWEIGISPGEKKEIRLSYTVKYPGDWSESYFNLLE